MVDFLENLQFFIFPSGLGRKRIEFFAGQVVKHGGTVVAAGAASHVVVDEAVAADKDACRVALKREGVALNGSVECVTTRWLSRCLAERARVDTAPFRVDCREPDPEARKRKCDEPDDASPCQQKQTRTVDPLQFLCSQPSTSQLVACPGNQRVIAELQRVVEALRVRKDTWRVVGYEKAIGAISRHPRDITSFQEAADLPNIGEKMAGKIMEIIECGSLRKAEELCGDEKTRTMEIFCKVWGAGPATAEGWYQQGWRTLDDLRTKAKLTRQQEVGLRHWDSLQRRIPRHEVARIGALVQAAAPDLHTALVGSYRRGKADCGDVDVMIVNDGSETATDILLKVTAALRDSGLLTDDLVTIEETGKHRKYFGVCRVPGTDWPHRRIDLFVVPRSELAAALMHYTGSAAFNRSIRLLAARKGMALTEHGLYVDTVRKGSEIISEGQLVPTASEEEIFRHLGLEYKPPEQRDH